MTYCRPPPVPRAKLHRHPHRIQPRPSAARHNVAILSMLEQASLDLMETEASCILVALANQCEVDPAIMAAAKFIAVPDPGLEGDAKRFKGPPASSDSTESTESTESMSEKELDRECKSGRSNITSPKPDSARSGRREAAPAFDVKRLDTAVDTHPRYNSRLSPVSPLPNAADEHHEKSMANNSSSAAALAAEEASGAEGTAAAAAAAQAAEAAAATAAGPAAAEAAPAARAAPAAAFSHAAGYTPWNDPILLLAEAAKVIHEEEARNAWRDATTDSTRQRHHSPMAPTSNDWSEAGHLRAGYKRKPGIYSPTFSSEEAKRQYAADPNVPSSRGPMGASAAEDPFSSQYLSMKHNPKVKRNAMHAYITYMIYTDVVQSRTTPPRTTAEEDYGPPPKQHTYYESSIPSAAMLPVNAGGDPLQRASPYPAADLDWKRPSLPDRSSLTSYGNLSLPPLPTNNSILSRPLTAFLHSDRPDMSNYNFPPLP